MDIVTQNKKTVRCEVLTDSGENIETCTGHNDTEETEGTMSGTNRQWREWRRQQ